MRKMICYVELVFFGLFSFLFYGCTNSSSSPRVHKEDTPIYRTIPVGSTDTIDVHSIGQVQLVLNSGASNNRINCTNEVLVEQKGNLLIIKPVKAKVAPSLQVNIYLNHLNNLVIANGTIVRVYAKNNVREFSVDTKNIATMQFVGNFYFPNFSLNHVLNATIKGRTAIDRLELRGDSQLVVNSLYGTIATVDLANQAKAVLNGYFGISHVLQKGSSSLYVEWLNGRKISIDSADKSFIQIAGETRYLLVHQSHHAQLEARYLRAQDAEIKTKNSAIVSLTALKHLFAEALGSSQIYYFGNPPYLYKNHDEGAVILQGK